MIDKETAIALAKEVGFKYYASWALGDDPKIIRLQALYTLAIAHAQKDAEPIWIQPDHLEKAKMGPYLCRVEPTQRMADFVPLFTHPAHDDTALLRQALEALKHLHHNAFKSGAEMGLALTVAGTAITALRERLGEKV